MNAALVTRINTAIIPTTPTAKHLATSFRPLFLNATSAHAATASVSIVLLNGRTSSTSVTQENANKTFASSTSAFTARAHSRTARSTTNDITQSSNLGANTTTHPFTPDPIARATRYAAPLLAYAPSIDRAGASPENSHGIAVSTPKTSLAVTSFDWNHSSGCTYPDANAKTTRAKASEYTNTRFVAAIAGAGDARATEVGACDYCNY